MKKTITTASAFTSWALLMTALNQGEWIMALAMGTTLALCFMIEAEMI